MCGLSGQIELRLGGKRAAVGHVEDDVVDQWHGNQLEQAHEDDAPWCHPVMHKTLPMQSHSQEAEAQTQTHAQQDLGI